MANDFLVLDGNGSNLTKAATDIGGGTKADAVCTNARRSAGVLHRNAITSADKLAQNGTVTLTAVTESGSNLGNVATYFAVAPYNRWGNGQASAVVNVTPTANQAVRNAWAQVTGADGYDMFCGTTAGAPLWVGRVTETQRASGGFIISAVGVVSAGSSAAGSIDIGILGSGAAVTANPFPLNNAYTPATPTPINCAGYNTAILHVKAAVTDLRSLPTATIVPFYQDQQSNADWFADFDNVRVCTFLTQDGAPLEQSYTIPLYGATNFAVLVSAIGGQGTAVSVWVELA